MSGREGEKEASRLKMIEIIVDNLMDDLPRILGIPVEKMVNDRERVKEELRKKMIEFLTLLLEKGDAKEEKVGEG